DGAVELALGAGGQPAGLGYDEAVAVAVHAQAANDQVLVGRRSGQAPALLANGDELAPVGHFAEKALQVAAVTAFDAQVVDELLEAGNVLGLAGDVMEDLLFGKHRWLTAEGPWGTSTDLVIG